MSPAYVEEPKKIELYSQSASQPSQDEQIVYENQNSDEQYNNNDDYYNTRLQNSYEQDNSLYEQPPSQQYYVSAPMAQHIMNQVLQHTGIQSSIHQFDKVNKNLILMIEIYFGFFIYCTIIDFKNKFRNFHNKVIKLCLSLHEISNNNCRFEITRQINI